MTPSGHDERRFTLHREESEELESSSASGPATSSEAPQDASYPEDPDDHTASDFYEPTEAELADGNWEHSGGSASRQGLPQSRASFSGFQSPPTGETVVAYSQDFFQKLDSRSTPDIPQDRAEGRSTSQAARKQQRRGSTASASTTASYPSSSSTILPPTLAQQDDPSRERGRPGYRSPALNPPRRSDSRSHRDREPRGSEQARGRRYPPQSSENSKQWHRHRRESSRTRMPREAEAEPQAEGSRRARYDDVGARERHARRDNSIGPSRTERRDDRSRVRGMSYQGESGIPRSTSYDDTRAREQYPRRDHDGNPSRREYRREQSRTRMSQEPEGGPSRTRRFEDFSAREQQSRSYGYTGQPSRGTSPAGRRYAHPSERIVFPGDESMFSPSYLQEMGDLRLGGTRRHNDREREGGFEDEYESDSHMYSKEYLRDMAGTRGWRGNPRS
ncbi:hypothetical protein DHEL01_v201482 [Diaporthe helianthi]|uniref:Uncharacterized protein n=1 Tax=Diaporthe helianthi TaxID=158607 RepID=A0A2P5IC78_DIAHE|nr:hypothetical protein DHEL01_v201482 [Diaporthe helianthi]